MTRNENPRATRPTTLWTLLSVLLLLLLVQGSWAYFDQSEWNAVVSRYVKVNQTSFGIQNEALVDYSELRISNQANFSAYLEQLINASPLESYDQPDQFAIAINAYNALAINMVLNNPCKVAFGRFCWLTASIRDISGFGVQVWDMPAGDVGGVEYTLNDLETFIRSLNDCRIHACIVCASASCPNIQPFAYTAEDIEAQKNHSMKEFLSNEQKGLSLDEEKNVITLSSIFLWYQSDFETFVFPTLNGGQVLILSPSLLFL